ncbi:hypothetical protein [Dyella sp.]|jgi:hypothetical protein|uniref:hypothetical protein n=1 Tax=Dyella sp. TaxID=1869338 RepID=UPI002D78EB78|nr:hypothetical protein [Dyella sp.]HET6432655.1 hypothetical protein [Dyella sp.]
MDEFIDGCSCRVWAIDGWINEERSTNLNHLIEAKGTALYQGGFKGNRHLKVAEFVGLRTAVSTARPCIIYGEFDSAADKLPTHMWLEYDGYIYDTIPGFRLRRKPATEVSRRSPGCVNGQYAANKVGAVPAYLSVNQYAAIQAADGHWAAVAGAGCDEFTPQDTG